MQTSNSYQEYVLIYIPITAIFMHINECMLLTFVFINPAITFGGKQI